LAKPKAKIISIEAAEKPLSPMDRVEQYLTFKYNFRYNEVSGKVEWKSKNEKVFEPITDYFLNSLGRKLNKAGLPSSINMLRNLLVSDFTPVFNPFKQYLKELPEWDGKTDYILELTETVTTTDTRLWQFCFRKWLVAMVGSLMRDPIVNQTVIVFSGKQGMGKTSFILNLIPPELKDYCFSGTINPANKDTLIQLSECMLINLDELENLNRSELGATKELITKGSIRLRRPYGYATENLPRRASFAGSVNGKEFLNDMTGNRRFLCFQVDAINYQHKVSLEGLYSQALYLFENGFPFWFNSAEIEMINKSNEQFRSMSVEEELLLSYFDPCEAEDADFLFSTTELVAWFTEKVKMNVTDGAKQKLGKALRAHKFLRIKKFNRYVYALKQKGSETEVPDESLKGGAYELIG
jgi:predicted P-loop ATPase